MKRPWIVVGVAVAALFGTTAAVWTSTANAAETLLSRGKPAIASSVENAATPAAAAVDGSDATRWSSAFADPQWIQVDLGAAATLTRVVLRWEGAYASGYEVQFSADAQNWSTAYRTSTGDGGTDELTVAGTGRYVRVLGTARATAYGYSLWEFEVYGETGAPAGCDTATDAARGRPATASSVENAATPAAAAVDGDAGTRWASGFADPQWIQVDLGAVRNVCRVVLVWEAAFARSYRIEVSNDGQAWNAIWSTAAGAGGTETRDVTGTGRYLRVYGTARATAYGYSLWSLTVNVGGTASSPPTSPPPGGTDVLLSYNKPAVASSSEDDGACWQCVPGRVTDLDPASRWATSPTNGWVDPGWIYVDLGATARVRTVVLQWDPAYATAYEIQLSADAQNWSTAYRTTTGRGFKETVRLDASGRYVRMLGTARSNGYGYSLWEFQVYGTGGAPTTPPARPADPVFPATRMVWHDEFDTPAGSKPDPAKWTIDPGTGQNNEQQYYTDNQNAQMDGNGALVIEARKENAGGRAYTSHRMNTGTKFHVQYGRIEARVKVPKGNGLWPAFWMMGADFLTGRPWPYNGEIDIMEVLGRNTTEGYSTLHAPAYNGGGGYGMKYSANGADLSADFHLWAVEWDSRGMRFFLDGRLVFTADKETVETTRGPWVFDHQFYLILNLAVGGDFPGPVDATTPFPSRMLVDFVRVYQ
ncbi:hypothetical protein Val02_38580 [Virgisporangium aliadipatigenens]|uniref:F5/8 type C domain-containing protein n=1 Tax=Virgisporangium aliadipatigenens TaxID=741659 RepID=A0A8J3YMF0_9ACTN|nr:discoidin domain-containing protein [Virgisporangium aliadipatigenens]GIJ46972.1 hypothetical protein Val02_38580 [Virgisporangium aliadipatigenens]